MCILRERERESKIKYPSHTRVMPAEALIRNHQKTAKTLFYIFSLLCIPNMGLVHYSYLYFM